MAFAKEFDVESESFESAMSNPNVDAVIVCTPSGLHAKLGVAALMAGKHVIVEKPMDVTVEACDRLLVAQHDSRRTLGVVSQTRFDRAAQQIKQAVDDDLLGQLIAVDCKVPWFRTQEYYDADDWRGTWQLDGGGCLINQGIHTVDLLRWICGPVTSVFAQARNARHKRLEVEDLVCATLGFADGAIGTLLVATSIYPGFPAQIAVHGTKGSAIIVGGKLSLLHVIGREPIGGQESGVPATSLATGGTRAASAGGAVLSDTEIDSADQWGEGHRLQLLDYIEAAGAGTSPAIDGQQGRNAVEVIQAIYQSARTGDAVRLPLETRKP
jgi:predicted dehydrogenase